MLADTAASRVRSTHELQGVEVERYNKHYFPNPLSVLKEQGHSEVPATLHYFTGGITVLPRSDWA
ncbi:MAG: hypothetical protein ACLU4N_21335 [Butyricimonas faecihominis]